MNLVERQRELAEHIRHEHKQSPFTSYFKEIVYGGIDGIITTFAVVAGFSGAALTGHATLELTSLVLLLFGLANLFADGVSMGLGNYLSIRSDQKLYESIRVRERHEIEHQPDQEAEETVTILMSYGFTEIDARAITILYRKNPEYWVDFMMNNELRIPDPREDNALSSGVATLIAFLCFGAIPLIPFIAMPSFDPNAIFPVSVIGTATALALLGYFKAKVSGGTLYRSMAEVVLVGGIAAGVAFGVGTIFSLA